MAGDGKETERRLTGDWKEVKPETERRLTGDWEEVGRRRKEADRRREEVKPETERS